METLEIAYVHKHRLYSIDSADNETDSKSEMSLDEYYAIMAMKNTLEDVTFRKQLNS